MNKKLLAAMIASAFVLAGCNDDDNNTETASAAKLVRLATTPLGSELTGMYKTVNGDFFFNVQHPSTSLPGDESKAAVGAWIGVDINNLDANMSSLEVPASDSADAQTTLVAEGSYQVLGREGDTFGGSLPFGFGAIVTGDESASIKQSASPDFNAFIPTNADSTEGYLYTAWEDRPGAVSRIALSKLASGEWSIGDAMNVDFSAVNGTMINCFGTVSPWGTPLTSEENYESQNSVNWNNPAYTGGYPSFGDVQNIQAYLGGTFPNPYDYGYIVELTEPTAAEPVPVKLFTLGRMAHENAVIMPDNKTVYLTDDGSSKAFFKFVADTAGDLSAGTMYAAKVTQDDTTDSATTGFDIAWIELGSSNNTEIEAWIDSYDGIDESDYVEGQTNYVTQAEIDDWAAGVSGDDRYAFIESLRAAEAKGATVEFNKMEGININYDGMADGSVPDMYVAMSDVKNAMSDETGDIAIDANRCGIVYRFDVDSDYNATRMEPAVVGGPYDGDLTENSCSVDGIASPDNVVVLDDGRVLIGEDTSKHVNNMLWVYNPNGQ